MSHSGTELAKTIESVAGRAPLTRRQAAGIRYDSARTKFVDITGIFLLDYSTLNDSGEPEAEGDVLA